MVARAEAPPEVAIRGPLADQLWLPIVERRWDDLPPELCFWGGAGTGKSFTLMVILRLLMGMEDIGGLRILWARKTRKSITNSSIVTYRKVLEALGMTLSAKPQPSQRQEERVVTPAGVNTLVWASLEDPYSAFSAEYDIVVFEEGIQVSEATYEMAGPRCLRNYALPWQGMITLTNPGPKAGWIYRRMFVTERLQSFRTTLHDNPRYWDLERQDFTREGRLYLANLKHMYTDPIRYRRMVMGEWASEEGWALDNYSEERHVFKGEFVKAAFSAPRIVVVEDHPCLPAEIELAWTFGSLDRGFVNAGSLLVWGVDAAGRMYLLEESYHTAKDRDWWCDRIIEATEKYRLDCVVADHDPEFHAHVNTTLAERMESTQVTFDGQPFLRNCEKSRGEKDALKVDVVRTLLNDAPDGRPRCYLNSDSLKHKPDPTLEAMSKPVCLHDEIPQLVWNPLRDDQIDEKLPQERLKDGRPNHAFDAWVYAGRFVRARDLTPDWTEGKPEAHPGTFEHHERFAREQWKEEGWI